jgi:hypothetical protein
MSTDLDIQAFLDQYESSNDSLFVVLKSHLLIEALLIRLLEAALPTPSALDLDRFGYLQKLELAAALSIIPTNELPPYRSLNKLRNQFAHRLNRSLSAQDLADLLNTLPQDDRQGFVSSFSREFEDEREIARELRMFVHWLAVRLTGWRIKVSVVATDDGREDSGP